MELVLVDCLQNASLLTLCGFREAQTCLDDQREKKCQQWIEGKSGKH